MDINAQIEKVVEGYREVSFIFTPKFGADSFSCWT